jgi:hypothetical protein
MSFSSSLFFFSSRRCCRGHSFLLPLLASSQWFSVLSGCCPSRRNRIFAAPAPRARRRRCRTPSELCRTEFRLFVRPHTPAITTPIFLLPPTIEPQHRKSSGGGAASLGWMRRSRWPPVNCSCSRHSSSSIEGERQTGKPHHHLDLLRKRGPSFETPCPWILDARLAPERKYTFAYGVCREVESFFWGVDDVGRGTKTVVPYQSRARKFGPI